MMARVPSEDVDEVQADWKKASHDEKKQMVWDVRKLLDDGEDEDDDDAPKPKHTDAPKPPPKGAPPPPRGGYKDDSKSEVRRRGGGAACPEAEGGHTAAHPFISPPVGARRLKGGPVGPWAREGSPRRVQAKERPLYGLGPDARPRSPILPPWATQAARAGRSTRTLSTTLSVRPTAATGTSTTTRRPAAPRAAAAPTYPRRSEGPT